MATTVEQIVNQALYAIGYPRRIGNIYEGTAAARAALEVYGQTRDEVLSAQDWPFARAGGALPLTLLKGPPPPGGYSPLQPWSPIYPAAGFLYEYAYPADCLELRAVIAPPLALPNLDPKAVSWRLDNDATPVLSGPYTQFPAAPPTVSGPPQKVILTNQGSALAVYRRRITNPSLWTDQLFVAMFIAALASKLSLVLTGRPGDDQAKMAAATGALADLTKG
ncbi:MAG TPA: hypothetical protein VKS24_25045 [Bradyrhizobium sp.]|nr:hypothetical protein [Bradyrhizobium sp.]